MFRARISAVAAAALLFGAVACNVDAPTGTAPSRGGSFDLVVGGLVCQLDNTVSGITDVRLQPLANEVCAAFNAGEISADEANGLLSKLEAAQAALERGNVNAAVNILNAFVNQAQAIFINRNCNGTELSGVCHTINGVINDAQHLIAQLLF